MNVQQVVLWSIVDEPGVAIQIPKIHPLSIFLFDAVLDIISVNLGKHNRNYMPIIQNISELTKMYIDLIYNILLFLYEYEEL